MAAQWSLSKSLLLNLKTQYVCSPTIHLKYNQHLHVVSKTSPIKLSTRSIDQKGRTSSNEDAFQHLLPFG